jgi:hypothetical protein
MRCLIPALFLTLIVACRDVTPGLSDALVQDSAGIAMVENTTPAWRDGQAWRVEPKPVLQLGQLDGDQPHMFANITGAVQLADGSIAVADAGSSQLRIFDPTGQHRRSIGGPGSGPGEFRVIAAMIALPGDSLLVVDPANRRITIVHAPTGASRSQPLPGDVGLLTPLALHGERSVIGYAAMSGFDATPGRDTIDVFRIDLDTGHGQLVTRLPGESRDHPRGFGPTPVIAAGPDGFWYGSGDTYELRRFDQDAALRGIARVSYAQVPVTAEMIAHYKAQTAEANERFGMPPRDLPFPTHLPPYAALLRDSEGNIWVRPLTTELQPVWNVLDSAGRYLGDVELPTPFVPFQIGTDFVLTRGWDDFGVEYVRLYNVVKP